MKLRQVVKPLDLIDKAGLTDLLHDFYYLRKRYSVVPIDDVDELLIKNKIFRPDELEVIERNAIIDLKPRQIISSLSALSSKQKKIIEMENRSYISRRTESIDYLRSEFNLSEYNYNTEIIERYKRIWIASQTIQELSSYFKQKLFEFKWRYSYYQYIHNPIIRFWYPTVLALYFLFTGYILTSFSYSYINYSVELSNWKSYNKSHSSTVYKTRTGKRYHERYHYSKRNYPTDLFTAYYELGLTPCLVCTPPEPEFSKEPAAPNAHKLLLLIPVFFIGYYGYTHLASKYWQLGRP